MDLEKLKEKLNSYSKEDIIITNHAEIQAIFREIELDEVIENILNPEKLVYFEEQLLKIPKRKSIIVTLLTLKNLPIDIFSRRTERLL